MNTKCRSNRDVAGKYRKYVVFAAGKRRMRAFHVAGHAGTHVVI